MNSRGAEITKFLHDKECSNFISEHIYNYVRKDIFDSYGLPEGISHDEMWEIIAGIRKTLSVQIHSALSRSSNEDVWYDVTPQMNSALTNIMYLASNSSDLSQSLAKRAQKGFTVQPFADEVSAALERDGLSMDYESLSSLVKGHRNPASDTDTIVSNFFEILIELPILSENSITPDSLESLYTKLMKNVTHLDAIARKRPCMPYYHSKNVPSLVIDSMVDVYQNYLEYNTHPLIAAISNSDLIWEYQPFPKVNGLMELLIRALFFTKIGCPALVFCPFSYFNLRWESDELSKKEAPFNIYEAGLESSFGIDVTVFFIQKIKFLSAGIEMTRNLLDDMDRRDNLLKIKLEQDFRLNHRQKMLLREMIDNPSNMTDVKTYSERHGTSLATARADLLKLIEFDYLYMSHIESKAIFYPQPDLPSKIEGFRSANS